jgi:hypothetical protein
MDLMVAPDTRAVKEADPFFRCLPAEAIVGSRLGQTLG